MYTPAGKSSIVCQKLASQIDPLKIDRTTHFSDGYGPASFPNYLIVSGPDE
jgi:hypothetical protein